MTTLTTLVAFRCIIRFIGNPPRIVASYALDPEIVFAEVGSGRLGLTESVAASRQRDHRVAEAPSRVAIVAGEIVESITEPLQLLLILVGVLSFVFGESRDAIAIFVIIALVAAVEAISEARARKALNALRDLSASQARVRRDSTLRVVRADEVVKGDVVILEAGDVAPGDARVLATEGLRTDESALTGEPVGAAKSAEAVAVDAPLAERSSMVFEGTPVIAGRGEVVITAVGNQSELGRLGALTRDAREPKTPLQLAMSELARAALVVAVAASVLVPLIGIVRGQSLDDMLLAGLTLVFATIPEELPILVTVLVAVGGLRLARRGVLLRRLRAAEAIGGVTVVLTDKTGTLTLNQLEVESVIGDRQTVLAAAMAANGLSPEEMSDPVDRALAASGASVRTADATASKRFPFDPLRKRESTAWAQDGALTLFVKGAPESVLSCTTGTDAERSRRLEAAESMALAGRRVLAVAQRTLPAAPADNDDAERDLDYLGLIGFVDPLREGVKEAVASLREAGVRTMVVTGDHPFTAAAIARQAGLDDPHVLLGGEPLAALSDAELQLHLSSTLVVARATPQDKQRLVQVLQTMGEAVAVTGDGVNDAPALAAANVGIAMGKRGTDLAREAADLVLTDDAFPTVVEAVRGGRGIGDQLRRAVAFYLGAKVALVASIAIPLALGMPSPFEPVHIVLLELFMDLGASVAFVSEPAGPQVMRRAARAPERRFLDRPEFSAIGLTAVTLTAATLPAFLLVDGMADHETASAAAVAAWLAAHAAIAWSLRSRPRLPFKLNIAFPVWALVAVATAVAVALTPIGEALGVGLLDAQALGIATLTAAAATAIAVIGQRLLSPAARL